ncbi:MAG: tRNA pseudouridine(13) synthase [Candidatus Fermentimicrarchaeum limneticum]|uniref:Probable tRNA pseudouridine synthase D n=1 Tax=Fermentimicrarchaeum limneticum TaxID=2795018 RepID=A0A7D6BB08_FERL1|nr:MAG: tRNA pseudouridine(13) synthase [Candidatus Fermentimicrarchaeum limneticum]
MDLAYLSKLSGVGGVLKSSPEDFIVEEITKEGEVLELGKRFEKEGDGDFTRFVLQKRNWNTLQALREIGNKLHCGMKRFGYAGVKDRNAVTTQLASAFRIDRTALLSVRIKDIQINGAWRAKEKVRIGELLGNRFTITARDAAADAETAVNGIYADTNGLFPNYFGEQRFGSIRKNTHLVGKAIVSGNFKEAVWNYLTYLDEAEREEGKEARKKLAEDGDFKKALDYFPKYLGYERTMLNHLSANPTDYVNALRKLPRGLSLMFVHAYQSYIFNKTLSKKISEGRVSIELGDMFCGKDRFGFPKLDEVRKAESRAEAGEYLPVGRVIGYETTELSDEERGILEEEGVSEKEFLINSFPELSSKGTLRSFFISVEKLRFSYESDKMIFNFCLPSGSYATSLMREFIDRCK